MDASGALQPDLGALAPATPFSLNTLSFARLGASQAEKNLVLCERDGSISDRSF